MFKGLFRAVFTLIGAVVGYGVFLLVKYILVSSKILSENPGQLQDITMASVCVIIFIIIFYSLVPALQRTSMKVSHDIESDLQSVSTSDLAGGVIGLVVGLFIAFLISNVYDFVKIQYLPLALTIVTYLVLGYIGVVIATRKGKEIFRVISNRDRRIGSAGRKGKHKHKEASAKILDTSVIIDGRIYDIIKSGFIEGKIVIPEFVLVELRHIADSSDSLKRKRGRRGLDVLNKIQEEFGVDIYDTTGEGNLDEIPEVDVKLLKLAQITGGKVVTNDFNLNKVAGINGVAVLNINKLANTLKPIVLPGENMTLFLVKEGKESNQALAYLDDGTMIVVEDGRKYIGQSINVNVTSVLQTAAGRMIFAKSDVKK